MIHTLKMSLPSEHNHFFALEKQLEFLILTKCSFPSHTNTSQWRRACPDFLLCFSWSIRSVNSFSWQVLRNPGRSRAVSDSEHRIASLPAPDLPCSPPVGRRFIVKPAELAARIKSFGSAHLTPSSELPSGWEELATVELEREGPNPPPLVFLLSVQTLPYPSLRLLNWLHR